MVCFAIKPADTKKLASPVSNEVLKEEDDVFSSGDDEVTGKSKSKKHKRKSQKVPKPLKTHPPAEATKSSDLESPKTPKSAKIKKPSWFRKRSSSDSKALKSKSAGKFFRICDCSSKYFVPFWQKMAHRSQK